MSFMRLATIIIIFCSYVFAGCSAKQKQSAPNLLGYNKRVSYKVIGKVENHTISVLQDVDLRGDTCQLPPKCTLLIKGGIIRNGVIIGNNTNLVSKGIAFDHVTIKGSWRVPDISTKLFSDLSCDNALKNVFALTNPKIKNTVKIEKGEYWVVATKKKDHCLNVNSNTTLVIDGTIRLRPNDYGNYHVLYAVGHDIVIKGRGSIIGDKHTHLGDKGEWGMGINLHGVNRAMVTGLSIRDCWGDCIYVGGCSKNVTIEKCQLDHGRRQGISVTSADSVIIRDCTITNVGGTNPQYGIDLEPNKGDTVDHVLIEKVIVKGCKGGFGATVGKRDAGKFLGNVVIRYCQITVDVKFPVRLKKCRSALVENCTINIGKVNPAIYSIGCDKISIKNNVINLENSFRAMANQVKRRLTGKAQYEAIKVENVGIQEVAGNRITEK